MGTTASMASQKGHKPSTTFRGPHSTIALFSLLAFLAPTSAWAGAEEPAPEAVRGCVSREGVYIYLSELSNPAAEDPKPLWDFCWYLGYDTEPTFPWLQ